METKLKSQKRQTFKALFFIVNSLLYRKFNVKRKNVTGLSIFSLVVANSNWGADKTTLLNLYRSFVRSKLNYGCMVYGSTCTSYLKALDAVHYQGLRLCLGVFRTSPTHSLHVGANEPPIDLR